MDNECSCQADDDEDTSSMEPDFIAKNVTNGIGHRLSAQESAMAAFDTLGLKRKSDNGEEKELDSRSY